MKMLPLYFLGSIILQLNILGTILERKKKFESPNIYISPFTIPSFVTNRIKRLQPNCLYRGQCDELNSILWIGILCALQPLTVFRSFNQRTNSTA